MVDLRHKYTSSDEFEAELKKTKKKSPSTLSRYIVNDRY